MPRKKPAPISTIPFQDVAGAMTLLDKAVTHNIPALLVGEAGSGKNTCLRHLARQHDRTLRRVSLNGATGVEEIVGKWLLKDGATAWVNGVLTDSMLRGEWVVFDEINAALPEILFALHGVLDDDRQLLVAEKDGEVVRPHADFRFFATMNPSASYAGTKEMNTALLSRFGVVIQMPHLQPKDEQKLIETHGDVPPEAAGLLTHAGIKLREAWKKEEVAYVCSTRDLLQAARLHAAGIPLPDALTAALINKGQTVEDRNALRDALKEVFQFEKEGRRVSYSTDERVFEELYKAKKAALDMTNARDRAVMELEAERQKTKILETQREILLKVLKDYIRPFVSSLCEYCREQAEKPEKSKEERDEWKKLAERAEEKMKQMDEAAKDVAQLNKTLKELDDWKQKMTNALNQKWQQERQALDAQRKSDFTLSTAKAEEPEAKTYTISVSPF